ncbi:PREDICTED: cleavage and polyadenylation specificity factor subunit 3-II isoform X1 [Theobroma cacao]|uniref:Cleavage and polyadenylation specificity factor subunit 3-II isoform X1 n=1 Tax=Theobroma cacao TaxID=3641 RepID=A0AB32VHB1_THECC|nr:PREDICTED: cleavage and polyadenylation specificity factor subunit 3-II isoform X1 [Theobroma cacao]
MAIDCLVLGAGQEVGKSCVVVSINGKRIMFDCGMHMGYTDSRRYPDFSLISKTGDFDNALTCVIITHFHLDHIGALPYFTEVCGYRGPIYMTYPTKALAPLMLEDYRKNMDRRGEDGQFTSDHITECMKKVIPVDLKQTVQVDKDLQIRAYYAGHVLGAAMFYAKVGDAAMVYTGDYNMTPDRHLGAAQIDRLQLDLLITESTYATTIRDSRYGREREFLKAVHNCVAAGGKVLIPTFALGRAQELCILLEDYWERMNLKVPIYFSSGLTIQANMYYKMLINWTSQKIKETYATHNAFDFKNVQNFDRSLINAPGPCVLFATPGMISGGFSLEVFMQWAPSEINLITLPGYCVAGTIGHKLMSGKPTKIDLDKDTQVDVRCQIHQLSFSPHTDAKGIMDLVKFLSPKHAILVHGEKPKMATLKERIQSELGIQCYCPANNDTVTIPTTHYVKADALDAFIKSCLNPNFKFSKSSSVDKSYSGSNDSKAIPGLQVSDERVAEGILVVEKGKKAKVIHQDELLHMLGENKHEVQFAYCFPMRTERLEKTRSEDLPSADDLLCGLDKCTLISLLSTKLSNELSDGNIQDLGEQLQVESFCLSICLKDNCPHRISDSVQNDSEVVFCCCSWSVADEMLAWKIISIMNNYTLPLEGRLQVHI